MGAVDTYPPQNVTAQTPTLAYFEAVVNGSAVSDADTDLTVTITVPAGRRIKITMVEPNLVGSVASDGFDVKIQEGATDLESVPYFVVSGNLQTRSVTVTRILSPAAGTHTYKGHITRFTGTGTLQPTRNSSTAVAFIVVEDITGSQLPVLPQSVPVGQIGFAQSVVSQTIGATSTETDLTGLSVNVVVPAGRVLRISVQATPISSVTGDRVVGYIKEGATYLGRWMQADMQQTNGTNQGDGAVVISPTAGSHTYKATIQRYSGTGSLSTDTAADRPAYILVEDITPTPALATGAPSSTLGYAEAVANQGSITTAVDLTGLTVAVTVAAGRRLRITAGTFYTGSAANMTFITLIMEGATQLRELDGFQGSSGNGVAVEGSVVVAPSAGTHTYKLQARSLGGTATLLATASLAYILVEDITGTSVPQQTGLIQDYFFFGGVTAGVATAFTEFQINNAIGTLPFNYTMVVVAYINVGTQVETIFQVRDEAGASINYGKTIMSGDWNISGNFKLAPTVIGKKDYTAGQVCGYRLAYKLVSATSTYIDAPVHVRLVPR